MLGSRWGNESQLLGGFSGDGGAAQDDSVKASLDLAHTDLDALIAAHTAVPRCVEKSDGSVPSGDDNIFVIAGGPILIKNLIGIVTVVIGANVATCTLELDTTAPAATVALSTAVAITDDAVGTSYYLTAASPGVFTPVTAGMKDQIPTNDILAPIGTIVAKFSAANTGTIKWYLVYKPLSPNCTVTAAA